MPLYFVRLEGERPFEIRARNNDELYAALPKGMLRSLPGEGAIILMTHDQDHVVPQNASVEAPNTPDTPFTVKRSRIGKSFLNVFLTPKGNTVDIIGLGCAQQRGAICGYAAVMNVRAAMRLLADGRPSSEIVDRLPSLQEILEAQQAFRVNDAQSKREALQALMRKLGRDTCEQLVAIATNRKLQGRKAEEAVGRVGPHLMLDFEAIKSLIQAPTDWSTREDLHRFNLFVEEELEGGGAVVPPVYEETSFDGRALLYSDYRVERPGAMVYVCSSGLPVDGAWASVTREKGFRPDPEEVRENICARARFLNGEPIPIVQSVPGFGGMRLIPSLVLPYLRSGRSIAWVSPQGKWADNHWKGIILKMAPVQRVPVDPDQHAASLPVQFQDINGHPNVVTADGPAGFSLRVYVLDSMTSGVTTLHEDDAKFVQLLLDNDEELYGPCCAPGGAVPAYCGAGGHASAVAHAGAFGVGVRGGAGGAVDDDNGFVGAFRDLTIADDDRLKYWDCPFCGTENVDKGEAVMACRACRENMGRSGGRRRQQTHVHDWLGFIGRRRVY